MLAHSQFIHSQYCVDLLSRSNILTSATNRALSFSPMLLCHCTYCLMLPSSFSSSLKASCFFWVLAAAPLMTGCCEEFLPGYVKLWRRHYIVLAYVRMEAGTSQPQVKKKRIKEYLKKNNVLGSVGPTFFTRQLISLLWWKLEEQWFNNYNCTQAFGSEVHPPLNSTPYHFFIINPPTPFPRLLFPLFFLPLLSTRNYFAPRDI